MASNGSINTRPGTKVSAWTSVRNDLKVLTVRWAPVPKALNEAPHQAHEANVASSATSSGTKAPCRSLRLRTIGCVVDSQKGTASSPSKFRAPQHTKSNRCLCWQGSGTARLQRKRAVVATPSSKGAARRSATLARRRSACAHGPAQTLAHTMARRAAVKQARAMWQLVGPVPRVHPFPRLQDAGDQPCMAGCFCEWLGMTANGISARSGPA